MYFKYISNNSTSYDKHMCLSTLGLAEVKNISFEVTNKLIVLISSRDRKVKLL